MVMCSFESSLFDHRVRLSTLNDASFWLVWHLNVAISHCFVFETCSYLFQFVDVHIGIFCTETFLRQSVHISLFKLYLSPHLFICTSVHLCIYTSLSCFLPLSPSPSLSLSLTLSHSRSPSQSLALSLSLSLSDNFRNYRTCKVTVILSKSLGYCVVILLTIHTLYITQKSD